MNWTRNSRRNNGRRHNINFLFLLREEVHHIINLGCYYGIHSIRHFFVAYNTGNLYPA